MERMDKATLLRKILPEAKRRCGDFLQNPQDLVLTFRSWNIPLCTDK